MRIRGMTERARMTIADTAGGITVTLTAPAVPMEMAHILQREVEKLTETVASLMGVTVIRPAKVHILGGTND